MPTDEPGRLGASALAQLCETVGPEHVIVDADRLRSYETDWLGRRSGWARAVVRPADTGQVADVIRTCAEHRMPVVTQGGNTGLVGGGVPRDGEVVLSSSRLLRLDAVDVAAGQVTVGAGVTLGQLRDHAASSGFEVGIDLAARDSATVGGLAATNAGGNRVVRYGMTRAQVVGVEAVTAGGAIVSRLDGLVKDNTGYDLTGLLVGSEGTLAVITAVRLRLFPRPAHRATALLALDSTRAALDVLARLRTEVPELEAADIFYREGLLLTCTTASLSPPFVEDHPTYLVVDAAGPAGSSETLLDALERSPEVQDAKVGTDAATRRALWQYRDAHPDAIAARGVPLKLDVGVPLRAFSGFVTAVLQTVDGIAPTAQTVLFGHLAEGNLHVNVLGLSTAQREHVAEAVLALVGEAGGAVSGEHGIGVDKVRWLSLSRSDEELALFRAVKASFDPASLLNPGVLTGP